MYAQPKHFHDGDVITRFIPTAPFLSKDSVVSMLIDMQLIGLPEYAIEKVDAELDPCWTTAINTLLRHKNIQAYHHLIWKARIHPQEVGGRRLTAMLKNCILSGRPIFEGNRAYVVYTKYAIDTNLYVNPRLFHTVLDDNNFFTITGDKGRLSDYYNTGL